METIIVEVVICTHKILHNEENASVNSSSSDEMDVNLDDFER